MKYQNKTFQDYGPGYYHALYDNFCRILRTEIA
jgi:hypothetical protein